ncbi:MAG: YbdD/YjiX family protein [Acidobacteriia bacterium]|nr:YbdD/YjiX family protein [Terriglobia bacterium]
MKMRFLHAVWKILAELTGEADYPRYCAHLRARHPGQRVPSKREFFLMRLEEKYTRPTRCC